MSSILTLHGEIWNGGAARLQTEFAADGPAAFEELDGEFALKISLSDDEFFLVRDPIGIHPLYFRSAQPELFSGFLRDLTEPEPRGNRDAVRSCSRQDERPAEGIYPAPIEGIMTLAPGHYLHCKSNRIVDVRRYWSPWDLRSTEIEKTPARFGELLAKAVEKRLRGAGAVAVSFSGGLDSSCIAACLKRLGANASLISYRFRDFPESNEGTYQSAIAHHLGLPLRTFFDHELEDRSARVDEQVQITEIPLADGLFSFFRETLRLAREAGADVLMTGHWGDQVLGPLIAILDLFFSRQVNGGMEVIRAVKNSVPPEDWQFYRQHLGRSSVKRMLRPVDSLQREYYRGLLTARYHVNCLEWNFKIGRHFGIPIRSPFLDREVIEFLAGAPPELIFDGGLKGILRRSFAESLPAKIIGRIGKADFTAAHRMYGGDGEGIDREALSAWRRQLSPRDYFDNFLW